MLRNDTTLDVFLFLREQVRQLDNAQAYYSQQTGADSDDASHDMDPDSFQKLQDEITALYAAAITGDVAAMFQIAQEYLLGDLFVERNEERAISWLKRAAYHNHVQALRMLGESYQEGSLGLSSDPATANYYFLRAAQFQDAISQFKFGYNNYKGIGCLQNEIVAFKWIELAAFQNYPEAQFWLGTFYYEGVIVPKDVTLAFQFYEAAAMQDHQEAHARLGDIFYQGKLGRPDYYKAIDHYFAGKYSANSMVGLGLVYLYGRGVSCDYDIAMDFFHSAEGKSQGVAEKMLGDIHKDGLGVEINIEKALKYYSEAAKVGNLEAQCKYERIISDENLFTSVSRENNIRRPL